MTSPYRILDRLREGHALAEEEIREVVAGATRGAAGDRSGGEAGDGWTDAQLAAFLMGAAIRGLDAAGTRALTRAMLESGERWELADEVPELADKHSTGGVADTVSLVLGPLLASCGVPVVMLTGRGLGHTGGTTDKLEAVPGLSLDLDRAACRRLLAEHGLAIGTQTPAIAPADGRLYRLRDHTATIRSIPLITASILSKKLATGAAAVVFDVKTGNGAFLTDPAAAHELARTLVEITVGLGRRASAFVTDMSQPLGEWAGHTAEVRATFECLEGHGAADLVELTYVLAEEMAAQVGRPVARGELEAAIASGRARELFDRWALAQGADPAWIARPDLSLAPVEAVVEAPRSGVLARLETQQLGLLLAEAGGSRHAAGGAIDHGVSLRCRARLGDRVEAGDELARLYLRREDDALARRLRACFAVEDEGAAPPLVAEKVVLEA
ncbi:MAG TPA: thymidine phosphorylase [Thermoanaerobaculia bacterium]|nr:thymidine phosphorylase [Thermoanaerobaculia bacterium]